MEAVPRLPMISFELKHTTGSTSYANLKLYIAECYQEDPETYSKEVYALESLRNAACRPSIDVNGCNTLKRYYCQLHSLQSRFPLTTERQLLTFSWRDVFSNVVTQATDVRFDMAVTLYNYGVLHGILGSVNDRTTAEGMKLACTHFQCAGWAFNHLRETFPQATSGDMSPELLIFMQELSFAQAQECILEKSLADNRKAGIVSKVTAQIISYYNAAYSALLNSGEDGPISDIIGNKNFKEWRRYTKFKISYLGAILLLYQGQQSEEQQKMGERVTLFQAAWDKLEEAKKESKGMSNIAVVNESLAFVTDVIEAKRKAAKNENEFIYHEEVPDISTFSAVQGANLVKGIGFSVTDPESMGEDIFHRLVPMKAHEASSLYSEEKANLLRKIGAKVEDKDTELNKFMGSLNVESLNFDNQSNRLPQGLVDRCAALNAKSNAIPDLVMAMSNLAEICTDVECMLNEIKELLSEEERLEQTFQKTMGSRTTVNFTELQREFSKYLEAHNKAGESNETLRKAMGLHVANLKTLAQPLNEVQAVVPTCTDPQDNETIKELHVLLAKVNEMRMQRALLFSNLRAAVTKDDITSQVISWGDKKLEKLFKKELGKHEKMVQLIEQNLSAQSNILRALTECYARCAAHIKIVIDTKHRREHFFSSLAASYDVYDDLLSKSSKGLEFYKKLQGNIQKLLSRIRGARDVQDEERQQRLQSTKISTSNSIAKSSGPKLKDYLKSGTLTSIGSSNDLTTNIPTIRPNPLGSETTTTSACVTTTFNDKYYPQSTYQQPNEPPPPYVPYSSQTIDSGYTNPMYQNTIQPPPYNLHNTNPEAASAMPSMFPAQYGSTQYSSNYPANSIPSFQTYNTSTYSNVPVSGVDASSQQYSDAYSGMGYQQTFQQQHPIQNPQLQAMNQQQPTQNPSQLPALNQPPIQNQPQQQNVSQAVSYPNNQQSNEQSSMMQPNYQMAWNQQTNLSQQMSNLSLNNNQSYGGADPAFNAPYSMYQTPYGVDPNQQLAQSIADPASSNSTYTTSTQPNYQFTANNQYVTGYDQTASVPVSQNQSFGSHPGYVFNNQTGEYQYGSGYQDATPVQNLYSQYTNVNMDQSSNTTQSTKLGSNGQSFVDQYANGTIGYDQSINTNNVYNSASGSYYNLPYGVQLCGVQTNVTPSSLSSEYPLESIAASHSNHSPSKSLVYMQSRSFINTCTSSSNQTENGGKFYDGQNQQQSTQNEQYLDASSIQQQQQQPQQHQLQQQQQQQQQPQQHQLQHQQQQQQQHQHQLPDQQQQIYYQIQPGSLDVNQQFVDQQPGGQTQYSQYGDQHQVLQQQPQPQQPQELQQPQQQNQPHLKQQPQQSQHQQEQKQFPKSEKQQPKPSAKLVSNIDLLSGLDITLSDCPLSTPLLQPKLASPSALTELSSAVSATKETVLQPSPIQNIEDKLSEIDVPSIKSTNTNLDRKSSIDNLSICSDISSVDQNFDWDSASIKNDERKLSADGEAIIAKYKDSFDDPKTLKWFHKEVERLEKIMETLNIKTLNGTTHLDNKWKEIQDLLVKDEAKRTTIVAKLFPEKNRSFDSIPYDHARILLPTTTDDYINAVHVKEVASGSPAFILAQTPLANTVRDFWCMIWSQKSTTIVCLHSPTEMLDPFFPQDLNVETNYGDYSVTTQKQFDLSHCIERIVKVTMLGADAILSISIVQIKSWPKNSPANILGISQNIITTYKQQKQSVPTAGPIILNCISGSERSGLVALGVAAILATRSKKPILINAVDVWYRICSQRKGALRDISTLELSMQVVLNNAHEILNKRGIMTSYQMKNAQATIIAEKEEINDPFSDLDPLWKLKQKNPVNNK